MRQLPEDQIQYMIEAYENGESTLMIAAALGVTPDLVAYRLKKRGVSLRAPGFRKGMDHHKWNGGRSTTSGGYSLVLVHPDDPFFCMGQKKADGHTYVLEHRLVMARHIGRLLADNETVHHIDGNKQNNNIENLELHFGNHGKGIVLCCADCGSHNIVTVPLKEPR